MSATSYPLGDFLSNTPPRRRKGEGSLVRAKNSGFWRMQWWGLDGKRHIRTSGSTDYNVADQLLRQYKASGVVPEPQMRKPLELPASIVATEKCIVCGEEYPRRKGKSLICGKPECRKAAP